MTSRKKWSPDSVKNSDLSEKEWRQIAWILDTRGHVFIASGKRAFEIGGVVITEDPTHVLKLSNVLDKAQVRSFYGEVDMRFYVNLSQSQVFNILYSKAFDEFSLLRPQAELCVEAFEIKSNRPKESRSFTEEQRERLDALHNECLALNKSSYIDLDMFDVKDKYVETLQEFVKRNTNQE